MRTVFVSGHLDLTAIEFDIHYGPRLLDAVQRGCRFVVGDARGADTLAQEALRDLGATVTVYHMFESPRNNVGAFPTAGGFDSDHSRDSAMTAASDEDLAWIRPGRERSGTAKNLSRRARGSG